MSWNMVNTTSNPQVNSHSEAASSGSRPPKRIEVGKSAGSSKSPRRASRELGSSGRQFADQRLDLFMRESASKLTRGHDTQRVEFVIGSPSDEVRYSPNRAVVMGSPPGELLRVTNPRPENVPIVETLVMSVGDTVLVPSGVRGEQGCQIKR